MPNINFKDGMNRSQPPFLSMMVRDHFECTGDREWLARKEHILKWEYLFWMTERITPIGLNRFHHNASEAEMIAFFDDCLVSRVGVSASTKEEKLEIAGHYLAEARKTPGASSRNTSASISRCLRNPAVFGRNSTSSRAPKAWRNTGSNSKWAGLPPRSSPLPPTWATEWTRALARLGGLFDS